MSEKKMEETDAWEAWNQSTYRTGSTQPPKNHGGLVAFLLGAVIFLCGISTALGLMNIRLVGALHRQSAEQQSPVAFSRVYEEADSESRADYFPLGFCGQQVSEFWNSYDELPQGIYITDVCASAAAAGLAPGDILIRAGNIPITDGAELLELLSHFRSGDSVEAVIYRDGRQLTATLTVD